MNATPSASLALDPRRTALVIVDVQNVTLAMTLHPRDGQAVLRNAIALADAWRLRSAPVVLVCVASGPASAGARLGAPIDEPFPAFAVPERWDETGPGLGPHDRDIVVTKYNWGAFYGTALDLHLRRRGVDTVVVCGIATNFGVESTARQAHEHGYAVLVAEDACAAFSVEDHAFATRRIFPRLGRVRLTRDLVAAIG